MEELKFMAIGDVIGTAGVEYIKSKLWHIRTEEHIDCVIANGENSASGNGIDIKSASALFKYGVDVITTGNHIWQKREIYPYLDEKRHILRPANYPSECPGQGYTIMNINGYRILIINVLGIVYMEQGLESPFNAVDRILEREKNKFDFGIVDIHAEATSEKIAFGRYLDEKKSGISMVFGTHTHVPTADARILKNGTGYITDIGMTGGENSVIGVKSELAIRKFLTKMPVRFESDTENIKMSFVRFNINTNTPDFDTTFVEICKL